METSVTKLLKNVGAYVKIHAWGFSACCLPIILVVSFVWLWGYNGHEKVLLSSTDERSFWTWSTGYLLSSIISLVLFLYSLNCRKKVILFNFVLFMAFVTAQFWCSFLAIPYWIPIILACLAFGFAGKSELLEYEDNALNYMSIVIYVILGILVTIECSREYNYHKKEQIYIERALKTPAVEVIDVKENFILTKEFGMEKANKCIENDFKKGDKVHRIPFEDGEVLIVKE